MEMDKFVALVNDRTAHAQEIADTRVGGFGGSDAKMFYKLGCKGLGALSNTDLKRIATAKGMLAPFSADGEEISPAMRAGHDFEDYVDKNVLTTMHGMEWRRAHGYEFSARLAKIAYGKQRECMMTGDLAIHFKVFAHADFKLPAVDAVMECKFSQKTTDEVLKTYAAQLQWYYMLGVNKVALLHGWGVVDPFIVEDMQIEEIEYDSDYVRTLVRGIALVDDNWNELDEMIYERGIAERPAATWLP